MNIHPTAIIEPGAKLGRDVTVGPFAWVESETDIGDGCAIGPHAVIHRYTTLGPGCRVHAGAVLGDLPQDLAFKNEPTFLKIGEGCVLREGVTINRGTKPGTATVVGNHCFLMANSHLGHNVRIGNHVILANGVLMAGYVEIGDRVFVGGNAAVQQFCRIGRLAMLAGLAALTKDLPPFCITRTGTLNHIVGLNVVGLRRAGIGAADRMALKKAFVLLFRSGLNTAQAVERVRKEFAEAPVLELCAFIEASKRGICRAGFDNERENEE